MFEESDGVRERRLRELQVRARSEDTRRTILDLLHDGPMSSRDLRERLAPDAPLSLVNYHLSVLQEAREVVGEVGIYRLAS